MQGASKEALPGCPAAVNVRYVHEERRSGQTVLPFSKKGKSVNATSIASRLASNGLQQHLYAEPTTVAEECRIAGQSCWFDSDCCNETWRLICEWWTCRYA